MIKLYGEELLHVQSLAYMGSIIIVTRRTKKDVRYTTGQTRLAFNRLRKSVALDR